MRASPGRGRRPCELMKLVIASTWVPFVGGGAEVMVESLATAVRARGHEAEVLRLPFHSDVNVMLPQMLAMRLHHVSANADRLICIRTPSYLIPHPDKSVWFIHHHRGAYDLWGTEHADLRDDPRGRALRDAFRAADDVGLGEARTICANSQIVRDRLRRYNGIDAEVVYPPLDDPERFSCAEYGSSLVYVSRVNQHKRQWLAVESMRYTETPVSLVIAGEPSAPADRQHLVDLIRTYDLGDRVTFRCGWLPDRDKRELLARCLAAVYCPLDEDSYGYASLEAHHSSKAVVCTSDSGGVLELVRDGTNGFVCPPDPRALAARFDELYLDRSLAERMGHAGLDRLAEMDISWDRALGRLLA